MSVSFSGSGVITLPDGTTQTTAVPAPYRNMVRNGAMMIDQRKLLGNPFNSSSGNGYTLDGWNISYSGPGGTNVQISPANADHPNFSTALFAYVQAATSSPSTSSFQISQAIEGADCATTLFGTANAKSVALSFWAKTNVPGTYSVALQNNSKSLSYVANYTISDSNRWTRVEITVPGPTTGTWNVAGTDGNAGIRVVFGLLVGSSNQTTANTWAAGNYYGTSSNTGTWLSTNGNNFYITGVQLETAGAASTFEYLPIPLELARNQRYFQQLTSKGGSNNLCSGFGMYTSSTTGVFTAWLQTPMLSNSPSVYLSPSTTLQADGLYTVSSIFNVGTGVLSPTYSFTTTGASGTGKPLTLVTSASGVVALTSEL